MEERRAGEILRAFVRGLSSQFFWQSKNTSTARYFAAIKHIRSVLRMWASLCQCTGSLVSRSSCSPERFTFVAGVQGEATVGGVGTYVLAPETLRAMVRDSGLGAAPTFIQRNLGYMIGIHKRPAKFILDQSERDAKPPSLADTLLPAVEAWGLAHDLCFVFVPEPLGPMKNKLAVAKFLFRESAKGDEAGKFSTGMLFSNAFFPLYQTLDLVTPREQTAGILALDSTCSARGPPRAAEPARSQEASGRGMLPSWLNWLPFVH